MPSAAWIKVVIGLSAAGMFALVTLSGGSVDAQGLRWLGGLSSAITLLVLGFDRWIWRWPGVRTISELAGSRVIRGTWRGTLCYVADGDGNPGQQAIYMAVQQTYSTIDILCYFPDRDSESWSLVAAIERGATRHTLRYIYRQQAEAPDRDRNRPTEGACELRLVGRPVTEIVGSYYAERGGKGKITFDGHSQVVAGSAHSASELEYREVGGRRTRSDPPIEVGGTAAEKATRVKS